MTCLRFTRIGRVILRVFVRNIMTDLRRTIKDFSQECPFTQWSPKLTCSEVEQTIPFSGAEFLKHHLKVGMIFSWAFGNIWCEWSQLKLRFFRYKKDTQYIPGRQQMILRRKWTIQTKTADMLYGTNERLFSFMVARHPFERILSAYRCEFLIIIKTL